MDSKRYSLSLSRKEISIIVSFSLSRAVNMGQCVLESIRLDGKVSKPEGKCASQKVFNTYIDRQLTAAGAAVVPCANSHLSIYDKVGIVA